LSLGNGSSRHEDSTTLGPECRNRESGKDRHDAFAVTLEAAGWVGSWKVFIGEEADPGRFVVRILDGHGLPNNRLLAEPDAWVSFDAISRKPLELRLKLTRIDRQQVRLAS
jgi:hypothetical protein